MTTRRPADSTATAPLTPSARMREKFLREVVAIGLPNGPGPSDLVRDADLASLPAPAERYLRFMNVVGRPRDWSFCARWDGRFRMGPSKAWMPCEVWQYNASLDVARLFHMRIHFGGVVPTYVRDLYAHGGGHMAGKLLDTFTIVDDESNEVTIGELVTYLNDALMFAPSMLLRPGVKWQPVNDGAFDVTLKDRGITVKGRVFVGADGAMTNFSTTDRFGEDPANPWAGLVRARWTTPVEHWTVVENRRRPKEGRAVWHFPSGEFCYAELTTANMAITYNVPPGFAPGEPSSAQHRT